MNEAQVVLALAALADLALYAHFKSRRNRRSKSERMAKSLRVAVQRSIEHDDALQAA